MSSNIIDITKNGVNYKVAAKPMTEWIWNEMKQNKWEEETFKIFDRFLKPENPYIDIGAWIGPTVLYGAQKAKHVYGIEPDPVAFAELMGNIALNPDLAPKITCINAALAGETGNINLYRRHCFGDSTASLIPTLSDENYCQIQAITLYDLVTTHNIENANFIKMDIEGGEYSLIPHLCEFLKIHKPTLCLSLHPGFLSEHVNLIASQHGLSSDQPVAQTAKLLDSLQFYRYIYDIQGNPVTREAALNVSSILNTEFVFTDECWSLSQ